MESKIFYRISNLNNGNGLWYNKNGILTDEIKKEKYSFFKCHKWGMPYNKNFEGYYSCCDTLKALFDYIGNDAADKVKKYGYSLIKYQATNYKYYDNHWLIDIESSKILEVI